MTGLRHIPAILRHLGPEWVLRRIGMSAEVRLGLLRRRCAAVPWPATRSEEAIFQPLGIFATKSPSDIQADEILRGVFRPFSGEPQQLESLPKWNRNLFNGVEVPCDRHWSELGDFSYGDIKGVWELSRWFWAYPLGRAYLSTGDEKYARRFLELAGDWMEKNPPNLGPNWKCGQEASIRLIAAAWALSAFDKSSLITPDVRARFAGLAEITGRRIEAHLSYALSQDNNHGISELVGLLTVGCMWPNLPDAERLKAMALAKLDVFADRLFAGDGSFSQHSSNYHRVALDALCWASAVLRGSSEKLPPLADVAAHRGARFLHDLIIDEGRVVRYGADDGARILPLTSAEYYDFRPTLAASAALLDGAKLPDGPWQDQARLLGVQADTSPAASLPAICSLYEGGLHLQRSGLVTIAFRCPTQFRFRPTHADHLHVSIFEDRVPVADDPGTVSYNSPSRPWANLASARFHNVPLVDDRDFMEQASRFLWLPWVECKLETCESRRIVGSHIGYRGFKLTREVSISQGAVTIRDIFDGNREAELSVRWHGPSRPNLERLTMSCDATGSAESWHHQQADGLGWRADRYGQASPNWCRILRVRASSATFTTTFPISRQ